MHFLKGWSRMNQFNDLDLASNFSFTLLWLWCSWKGKSVGLQRWCRAQRKFWQGIWREVDNKSLQSSSINDPTQILKDSNQRILKVHLLPEWPWRPITYLWWSVQWLDHQKHNTWNKIFEIDMWRQKSGGCGGRIRWLTDDRSQPGTDWRTLTLHEGQKRKEKRKKCLETR